MRLIDSEWRTSQFYSTGHLSNYSKGMANMQLLNSFGFKFVLVLSFMATSFAFIVRNECEESGEFSVVRQNYILNGSVISTLYNQTLNSCKYHCTGHYSCKSFNMEKKEPGECQLNSITIEESKNTVWLIRKHGWIFSSTSYGETNLGKYCQKYKPCQSGQICRSTCTCPGYECLDSCNTTNKIIPDCPKITGLKNCAFNKAASLDLPNSNLASHPTRGNASNAVNGIYETKAYDCAVSDTGVSPEFKVDLGADILIHEVRITGGCMGPFDILVASSSDPVNRKVCRNGLAFSGYELRTFTCNAGAEGRYLYVRGQNSLLHLCEVEAYGQC